MPKCKLPRSLPINHKGFDMSPSQHSKKFIKFRIRRTALIATLSLTGIVAPLTVAPAAEAVTTRGKCSVTPLRPFVVRVNSSGVNVVRYPIKVSCEGLRDIRIQQRFWEDDEAPDADDAQGEATHTHSFFLAGTITLHADRALKDTEPGGEEIFHDVRFRVTTGGVTSGYTAYEKSPMRRIFN